MKGVYITRHNESAWIILHSLLTGRLGSSVVMHDAGHKHDAAGMQLLQAADDDWGSEQGQGQNTPHIHLMNYNSNEHSKALGCQSDCTILH
jgi:hypothetical protein